MSLMCDCLNCGGEDEFAVCQNSIMNARISITKQESQVEYLWVVVIVLGVISLGLAALTPIQVTI